MYREGVIDCNRGCKNWVSRVEKLLRDSFAEIFIVIHVFI
jgi:hypothetical protein